MPRSICIHEWRAVMNDMHEHYMKIALSLAEQGRVSVSPNPLVGCVLVKENRIIGTGWHEKAGGPHAEYVALNNATQDPKGAIAYITLEPCSHIGRTPPCAPRLIEAGVAAVYVATLDPNPLVNGQGIAMLQNAGIAVFLGLCEEEARQQNRVFFHVMKHQRPFVLAKWAMSLDGKISVQAGDDRQLSSFASQQETHRLRHEVDAILIGAHTALLDDPLLTVRHQEVIHKHPIRIVLGGKTPLPFTLRVFDQQLPGKTWVVVPADIDVAWYDEAMKRQLNVTKIESHNGKVNLLSLMQYLSTKNITSLLVEGGMTILNAFLSDHLIDEWHVFITPYIIGQLPKKLALSLHETRQLGSDYYITATSEENHV